MNPVCISDGASSCRKPYSRNEEKVETEKLGIRPSKIKWILMKYSFLDKWDNGSYLSVTNK